MNRPTSIGDNSKSRLQLMLVLPVYNEEECIVQTVEEWLSTLRGTLSHFKILVIDDGSTDGTPRKLQRFQEEPEVEIVHKDNSGHGPTILSGYRRAVGEADWAFQADSDNEISPRYFIDFWEQREQAELIIGRRIQRRQALFRRLISRASCWVVWALFGNAVKDVNAPFRLMRADALAELLPRIPEDAFAPNTIISGLCARKGFRVLNPDVIHNGRTSGRVSLVKWRLWRSAFKAFWQTIAAYRKA